MKKCFRTAGWIVLSTAALFSCANDMEVVNRYIDTETEPDLTGDHVEVFYSDSARLQMKLTTPLIKKYESAKDAHDEFPEGLHVWFYEKNGDLKAEITANWAHHDITTDLWEARSNVVIISADGRKLETEQLFWDPRKGDVYSEKYTKLTEANGSTGVGDTFTAKQDFSEYKLRKGGGLIILQDEDPEPEDKP